MSCKRHRHGCLSNDLFTDLCYSSLKLQDTGDISAGKETIYIYIGAHRSPTSSVLFTLLCDTSNYYIPNGRVGVLE